MKNKPLIDQLEKTHTLDLTQWEALLSQWDDEDRAYAAGVARRLSQQRFGTTIYVRGVVEFSNYCRNDCLYCGIRHSNANAIRYRMTKEQILSCCQDGYQLGFRTVCAAERRGSLVHHRPDGGHRLVHQETVSRLRRHALHRRDGDTSLPNAVRRRGGPVPVAP
ncbi:MAG: hypothetical protein LKE28_06520 [Sphaerochaeta sp.]|nr:hypothetical protein [Sphaerochaeta sp.]